MPDDQYPQLTAAVADLDGAREGYEEAARYDSTDLEEQTLLSSRARQAIRKAGLKFVSNYASAVIDAVGNRLETNAITGPDTTTTDIIRGTFVSNDLPMELPGWMRDALRYGDGYLLAWPTLNDDGTYQDPTAVDITWADPLSARVFYDHTGRRKQYAVRRWVRDDGRTRANLMYPDRIEKYITVGKNRDRWEPWTDDAGQHVYANEFGEVPVFHLRTHAPYGRPEHLKAYGAQNAIAKLTIYQMVATEFQGFPQRYALSHGPSSDTTDDPFAGDQLNTVDNDAEQSSSLESGPGGIWWLSELVKEVGQFKVADPAAFLEPIREHIKMMGEVTATPMSSLMAQGDPSGESVKVRFAPLDQKVAARQLRFGAALSQLFAFVLRVHGVDGADVQVEWRNTQPKTNDLDTWQVVEAKIAAGIPRRQALIEAGYTPAQVDEFDRAA